MPEFSVKLKLTPREVEKKTLDAAERGMVNCATGLHKIVVGKISRSQPRKRMLSRSGRQYVIGLAPSAPGSPPKVLTARLRQGLDWEVIRKAREVRGRVGSNVKYHRALELGFTGKDSRGRNRNLKARPHMRPSVKENKKKLLKLFLS